VLIEALREAEAKGTATRDIKAAQVLRDRRHEVFDDPATRWGATRRRCHCRRVFRLPLPYCKPVHPAIQKLLDQDPKLRFVYKEFPVLGEQSDIAAHAALAARHTGRYEPFHNAMMAAKGKSPRSCAVPNRGLDRSRCRPPQRDMTDPRSTGG